MNRHFWALVRLRRIALRRGDRVAYICLTNRIWSFLAEARP